MSKLPQTFPSLDSSDPRVINQFVTQMFQRVADAVNNPDFGATGARPGSQLSTGQFYFDTTLGKPIWWSGAAWVDATGAPV